MARRALATRQQARGRAAAAIQAWWRGRSLRARIGGQHIGDSGGSLEPPGPLLEPPGPLLTHLRTVCMAHSECLPTCLNPLAERTCFSQATRPIDERVDWLVANLTLAEQIRAISPQPDLGDACGVHTCGKPSIGLPNYFWLTETNTGVAAGDLRATGPLSKGVQARRKALRIRHKNGMEVHKKRPRGFKKDAHGVQVSPLNPLSVAPCNTNPRLSSSPPANLG